jgi:hypothetical protein
MRPHAKGMRQVLDVSRNAVTVISGACGKGRGLTLLLYEALSYSCMNNYA